jgi:hypothetical protein
MVVRKRLESGRIDLKTFLMPFGLLPTPEENSLGRYGVTLPIRWRSDESLLRRVSGEGARYSET